MTSPATDVFLETPGALGSHVNRKVKGETDTHPLSTPPPTLTGHPGTVVLGRWTSPTPGSPWTPILEEGQAVQLAKCFESGCAGPQGSLGKGGGENYII